MQKAAVFDFDGTVIRGDSVVALLFYARKRRQITLGVFLRAALYGLLYSVKLTDALTAKRHSHAFLSRLSAEDREALLRDFARTLADRAYSQALRQMRLHQSRGEAVVLCSASCQCYMQYVAALLPVDALLCTPCAADGSVLGPNCRKQEKVRRVYAWLDTQGLPHDALVAAYGDSGGDADILQASAHPVLVNPRRALRRKLPNAEQVRWS